MNLKEMKNFLVEILPPTTIGYGNRSIPILIDQKIADFIDSYEKLDHNYRNDIRRKELIDEHKFIFLVFAKRMACLAVRMKSEKEIYRGLGAIFFQSGLGDDREDLIIYTLLYDAGLKIGIDSDSLFLKAVRNFNHTNLAEIQEFLERPAEKKSPQVMGYIEGKDDDGFRYIRTW